MAARLLELRVRIPPEALIAVSCVCVCVCALSVDIPATDRSHLQRSPTECDVSECDREASTRMWPGPTRAVEP